MADASNELLLRSGAKRYWIDPLTGRSAPTPSVPEATEVGIETPLVSFASETDNRTSLQVRDARGPRWHKIFAGTLYPPLTVDGLVVLARSDTSFTWVRALGCEHSTSRAAMRSGGRSCRAGSTKRKHSSQHRYIGRAVGKRARRHGGTAPPIPRLYECADRPLCLPTRHGRSRRARQERHHRVPLPELIIAAVAEKHGLVVLHYDADFDRIAEVSKQATEWVVPRGTA